MAEFLSFGVMNPPEKNETGFSPTPGMMPDQTGMGRFQGVSGCL